MFKINIVNESNSILCILVSTIILYLLLIIKELFRCGMTYNLNETVQKNQWICPLKVYKMCVLQYTYF
jgi:hypothetical protein